MAFFYVTYGENVHPTKKEAPMIKKRILKTDRKRHISGGFRASELTMLRLDDITPEHSTLGVVGKDDPELDDLIAWENKKDILDWLDSL